MNPMYSLRSYGILLGMALGFYIAYRLIGSTSMMRIEATVVLGFVLAAIFCCVFVVLADIVKRRDKRD